MTADLWLRNLGAFAAQSGLLVLAGGLLVRAFRLDEPRASLAYWRTLLLACLLLPLCQPWKAANAVAVEPVVLTPGDVLASVSGGLQATSAWAWPSLGQIILIIAIAGIAARAVWLAIGAWALRRIRREASPLDPLPEAVSRAQERVGVRAGMYVSTRISGPITFGLLRPIVVFPPAVAAMESSIQHAIACHELLHVRRHDWLFEVLEEGVRTVLWFHPAIWWLIGRIQLSREQVVDQAAIDLTESKERYVEALLAVAIAKSPGILTPAPAFLRRRLLKRRVAQILMERTMTTRRLILSLVASAGALTLAATMAVRSFPLEAHGQTETGGGGPVQIVKGGDHLLHGELPEYPHRAIEQRVQGDVLLDLAVDDQGEVSDARVLTGPDELRKAALGAVLSWHYAPSAVRSLSTQATLRFRLPAAIAEFRGQAYIAEMKGEPEKDELSPAQQTERLIMKLDKALADPQVSGGVREVLTKQMAEAKEEMARARRIHFKIERDGKNSYSGPLRLVAIRAERVSDEAMSEVLKRAGVKVGDTLTDESLKKLRAAAAGVDEHLRVVISDNGQGDITVTIVS